MTLWRMWKKLNRELAEYKEDLLKRPQVIAANKTDIPGSEENVARLKEAYEPQGFKVFPDFCGNE